MFNIEIVFYKPGYYNILNHKLQRSYNLQRQWPVRGVVDTIMLNSYLPQSRIKILIITSSDTILAQGMGFGADNKYQGLKFVAGKYLALLEFTR